MAKKKPIARAPQKQSTGKAGWLKWLASAVIIGAIGSGVWEVVAKPGLSHGGRIFLDTVTLGSTTVKDFVYNKASLDPTAYPAVFLCSMVLGAVAAFPLVSAIPFPELIRKRFDVYEQFDAAITADAAAPPEAKALTSQKVQTLRLQRHVKDRQIELFLVVPAALCVMFFVASFSMYHQAISVFRIFRANLTICAPYISDENEERLHGQFAAMTTRAEYQLIDAEFKQLAEKHGFKLRKESLW